MALKDFPTNTEEMARFLIGKTLIHKAPAGVSSGRIVETEAYVVGDASSHAFRGQTPRNQSMFLRSGHAYVYRIYGVWVWLNVVSEDFQIGAAVLLRALEPLEGVDLMIRRSGTTKLGELAR